MTTHCQDLRLRLRSGACIWKSIYDFWLYIAVYFHIHIDIWVHASDSILFGLYFWCGTTYTTDIVRNYLQKVREYFLYPQQTLSLLLWWVFLPKYYPPILHNMINFWYTAENMRLSMTGWTQDFIVSKKKFMSTAFTPLTSNRFIPRGDYVPRHENLWFVNHR